MSNPLDTLILENLLVCKFYMEGKITKMLLLIKRYRAIGDVKINKNYENIKKNAIKYIKSKNKYFN